MFFPSYLIQTCLACPFRSYAVGMPWANFAYPLDREPLALQYVTMVNSLHVGMKVEYRGDALGKFPKGIEHVVLTLVSICNDAAFLEAANGRLFGVSLKDCSLPIRRPGLPLSTLTKSEASAHIRPTRAQASIAVSVATHAALIPVENDSPSPLSEAAKNKGRNSHRGLVLPPPTSEADWSLAPVDNIVLGESMSERSRTRAARLLHR